MTNYKINMRRGLKATTLLLAMSACILLSGCAGKAQTGAQGNTPAPDKGTAAANQNNTGGQPEQQKKAVSETEGLPSGVKVQKVLKDISLKNNYHKKVELLTDGGKRIMITDPSGGLVLLNLEYEGIIQEVSGRKVTVQLEHGGQRTITIPDNMTIEDDDNLGLNKGVEIEWTVDADGNIQSVELDD
ncbi:hypothetical protein [Paenibacillus woosongensis]|uniref:Uncharacterized protein n=1 Tax=Paenibacillus woosongensis TaxID=307580 RepID=A0A7X2Z3A9_9BACL|nr:hypothetical protein [Paenibacillus woosongensis]MUG46701.1 hypothetical protein [Paenibacillus woosongensis]